MTETRLFDFEVPEDLIAQYPKKRRDEARLLVLDRRTGRIEHRIFKEIVDILSPGDLVVFNNSRVIPARLILKKPTGGTVEILIIEKLEKNLWRAMAKRAKRIKEGMKLFSETGEEIVEVVEKLQEGEIKIKMEESNLWRFGKIPLPPYIKRKPEKLDESYYQTVFAKVNGSSASPTASLHFTENLLKKMDEKGIMKTFITLHIGPDTFRPIKEKEVEAHRMHREYFVVPEEAASLINRAKKSGKRVVACGTTVVRALESVADSSGRVREFSGYTDLFIYPPYNFKVVDALITNFHFPRSTLIVLVSAFAGRDLIMKAYEEARKLGYRFFSYGDAMLIL